MVNYSPTNGPSFAGWKCIYLHGKIQFTRISPNIAPENSWSEDDPILLGPGLSSGVLAVSFRKGIWSIIIYLLLIIYITLWISLIHSWKYACSHLFLFDFHHNFLNGISWHPSPGDGWKPGVVASVTNAMASAGVLIRWGMEFFRRSKGGGKVGFCKHLLVYIHGCFCKWWYPQNNPKWSFLVGKPMVVGYHHFRKPPHVPRKSNHHCFRGWFPNHIFF